MIKRLAISCAACIAATSACISLSCPGFRSNTTGQPTRQELLARHQILARIVEQIDQGNLGAARVTAQSLVDAPLVPEEIIQGRRLLATIAQRQRDFPEADAHLRAAMAELDARPDLAIRRRTPRGSILMDQAQLAAFGRLHREEAIAIYDQVLARPDEASPRDQWIAAQNAAMLCVELGRYSEAVQRVDALLLTPAATEIPARELIALRASQASWPANAGDLAEAKRRSEAVWRDYQDQDDQAIFEVGLRLARWLPAPQKCAERLQLASTLLEKTRALRATPSINPNAPTPAQLDDIDQEILKVIADSHGCNDPMVPWARQALGLPPQP